MLANVKNKAEELKQEVKIIQHFNVSKLFFQVLTLFLFLGRKATNPWQLKGSFNEVF